MMKTIQIALTAAFLLGLPGLVGAQDKEEPSAEEKERQEINAMAKQSLDRLFAQSAGSKNLYDKAYGYAVFAGTQTALALAGGRGKGVAVDKKSGKRTYMKLTSVGAGVGVGIQKLKTVFLFETKEKFDKFVEGGWEGDSTAGAAAGQDAAAVARSFTNGMAFYQLNDKGLIAQASVKGTKYSKNDKLNAGG
jgi:lipid-binding SYLF domain-containing protein